MPENVSNIPLGTLLRQMREEKGWSLSQLAEIAKISRSYLAQIESGESIPTQAKIIQLANAFGALPSELLGEEPEKINISDSLRTFAETANLGSAEIQMLARIEYRGNRPNSVEEWRAIYSVIKGMLGK
jgi:transcriptional regulator with XRE-family HTH domain